jgi:hypothetical protein
MWSPLRGLSWHGAFVDISIKPLCPCEALWPCLGSHPYIYTQDPNEKAYFVYVAKGINPK